jgi:hypothetical protein
VDEVNVEQVQAVSDAVGVALVGAGLTAVKKRPPGRMPDGL